MAIGLLTVTTGLMWWMSYQDVQRTVFRAVANSPSVDEQLKGKMWDMRKTPNREHIAKSTCSGSFKGANRDPERVVRVIEVSLAFE